MAKSFSNSNPLNKLSENPNITVTEPSEEPKKRAGRHKTKDVKGTCKNINVAVPIVLLDKWKEVKIVHGSNLTEYVTKLIERDMNENYEKYKSIADSLKNI